MGEGFVDGGGVAVVAYGNVPSIIDPYRDLPLAVICLWLLGIIHVLLDNVPPTRRMS